MSRHIFMTRTHGYEYHPVCNNIEAYIFLNFKTVKVVFTFDFFLFLSASEKCYWF